MRLDITGRHVEITPPLRQLIDKRLKKLTRLLNDSVISAQVILTREKYRHRTEIVIHARGDHMMRGLGEGNAWPLSLRQAAEKVEQQAQKLKGKWTERKRGETRRRVPRAARAAQADGDQAFKGGPEPGARTDAERGGRVYPEQGRRVVRATRYAIKPMSLEDAALRVDEGAESFVVFRNADTEAVSILYRRKDGNLGLIEPD
jgi:putative sigma-54 modulation protein